jgi:phosphate transport system permease protein
VIAAIIPLGSILLEVIKNGAAAINADFVTRAPGSMYCERPISQGNPSQGNSDCDPGGIGPAIQGTLIIVGIASLISAPVGVLGGMYLAEFSSATGISNKFANAVRFFSDVMTGLPSIVVGIVGYATIVVAFGFSVWAGAFALSIIMIPIVVRVTEETMKIVPDSIREAGHSLGIRKWKVVLFIVLRSAKSGVLTGIVLAISRIAGETAPLIMTILGTSLFFTGFSGPIDALPLRIWRLASLPFDTAHSFGWGAALILITIVLILSVSLRVLGDRRGLNARRTNFA